MQVASVADKAAGPHAEAVEKPRPPNRLSSEIPPHGIWAAACNWNREALTKSLDLVPRAAVT
jgi:hypothetical protein